jgi:alpha-1,2-mannosyltransferase
MSFRGAAEESRGRSVTWVRSIVTRRLARLLTWKRARTWAFVLGMTYVYAWCLVVGQGRPPLSSANDPIGGDYVAFYAAGRILLSGDGAHLYDHATVTAVQDIALEGRIPGFYDAFRNPPFFAAVFAPLSALDLVPSFAVWSLLSLAALLMALRLLCDMVPGMAGRWRGLFLIAFAFGPVYFGLIDGQNSTLSLLLFVLIYRSLLLKHDRLAGVVAAVGLFKPQLFFVFPLVFLAARRWRALASYAAAALVLAAVSFALVGVGGLQGWLRVLLDMETDNALKNAWRMHSLKGFFDLLLPGQSSLALALYALAAVALLAVLWRAWGQPRELTPQLWVLTSAVIALVDPHLVDYDLTALIPAGVMAAIYLPHLRWLILAMYPLLVFRSQLPLSERSLQITTLVLLGCAAYAFEAVTARRSQPAGASATLTPVPSGTAQRH